MKTIKNLVLFLIVCTPFLMGNAACTTDVLKAANAVGALTSALTYEPSQAEIEAEHRAFLNVLEANRKATLEWMQRYNIPAQPGLYGPGHSGEHPKPTSPSP